MRNLGIIVAVWMAVLLPSNALALGLGEIEVNSFLNQPLNAEIQVISARAGEIDDLLVSLASREAFTRAGLSRPRNLSELRFEVRANEAGDQAVIIVSTKTAVKEPFLNFLIEADWSKGRVLREFTVLLDPPFYADQPAPIAPSAPPPEASSADTESISEIVEQAAVVATEDDGAVSDTEESTDDIFGAIALQDSDSVADGSDLDDTGDGESITEPIALSEDTSDIEPGNDEFVEQESQNIMEGDVLVVKGDTLWGIASQYKDDSLSMSQILLAFQRANPEAFTNGNINNMKEGAILRVPSREELSAVGQQEAYAEVLVQNGLWDDYVLSVTGVSPSASIEEPDFDTELETDFADNPEPEIVELHTDVESDSELSLLVPGEGSSESSGFGDSAELEELRTQLALTEEELEASRIENQELESRIAELEARLSKLEELQSMVEIEDDSLALLQDQQQSLEPENTLLDEPEIDLEPEVEPEFEVEPEIDLETEIEVPPDDISSADEEALIEELLAEEAAAQAEEQVIIDGDDAAESLDEIVDDEILLDDDLVLEDAAQTDTETQIPPPVPVIVTGSGEPSIFDDILPPDIIAMIPAMPDLGGLFDDPIILGSIGGAVVVVLLAILFLARRGRSSDDDSGIIVSSDADVDDDFFSADSEDEFTPISLADGGASDKTGFKMPDDNAFDQAAGEPVDDFVAGEISQPDGPEPELDASTLTPPKAEQDDVLNEVDVYLAYGLYDNAEELLNGSLSESPERADYRSKLLDTYFATKNTEMFVKEAETLKSMGEAGMSYWSRVQVMGYELAPDNPLFSAAKDSGLSAADLEISRPQEADFDLGSGEDDETSFSSTDFNLGEVAGDSSGADAGEAQIPELDELPDLDDLENFGDEGSDGDMELLDDMEIPDEMGLSDEMEEIEDLGLDLPDGIGDELEFAMDDVVEEDDVIADEDDFAASFDLADDLDLDGDGATDVDIDDSELMGLEAEIDDDEFGGDDLGEDPVELGLSDDDPSITDFEEDDLISGLDEFGLDDDSLDEFGIEDGVSSDTDETSLATSELNLDTGELELPMSDELEDEDEDISIIDFGGEDFVEPMDLVDSPDDDEDDDEPFAFDVDMDDDDEVSTGTFAPGDFDEPTAAVDSISDLDDISEFLLPDDVDEVSTKLDLARAFIDMGDTEGARGSLEEVMSEGNEEQKAEAKALLEQT